MPGDQTDAPVRGQGRGRDPAGRRVAPADEPGIAGLLVQLDPGKALLCFAVHSDALLYAEGEFIALQGTAWLQEGRLVLPSPVPPGMALASLSSVALPSCF